MSARVALVVLLVATVVVACGGASGTRTPVIVDTDLSSDDAIALLYLAQDERVDLRAVTVAGTGLVHCPDGARIAIELLALAGRDDVPVACGAQTPTAGFNAPPEDWRRAADHLFGLTLPPAARRPEKDAARLLRASASADSEVTVLELAPMTNLATALAGDRHLTGRLRRVVAMAGAVNVPGNVPDHPAAEMNAWADPAAARAVLRSGVPVTLVPLDATNQVPVTTEVAQALARYHYATPEATFVSELVQATGIARGGSFFWDPLAAASVTDPHLVRSAARRVDVVTSGPDSGRTIAERGGAAVRVTTSVDRPRFERTLIGTLLDGARFTIPAHRPDVTLTLNDSGCTYRGARSLTAGTVVIDTVNRTNQPMQYAAGRIALGHTLAELRRLTRTVSEDTEAPAWFTADATGDVPPHSTVTWQAELQSGTGGETAFVCLSADGPRAWVTASVPVFTSR